MTLRVLSQASLLLAAACFLLGTGATVIDVILRAVAGRNLPGVIEFTTLAIGLGALLSMPICFLRDTNVTARLLSELRPVRFRRPLSVLGSVFSVVFAAVLAGIMALYAADKWNGPETTSDLQLHVDWLLVIVGLTFVAALVAAVFRCYVAVRGREIDG